jgi:AcrR family transcriptional regulator
VIRSVDVTERILDAAGRLFAERGYVATTTRATAADAGVNEVTLFRRFTNKAGVLRALGERIIRRTAGKAAQRPEDSSDVRAALFANGAHRDHLVARDVPYADGLEGSTH